MSSSALNIFFDTSALVKYFYDEPGSDQVMMAFRVESLNRKVVSDAEALLKTYGQEDALRTLDALHLATYLLLADRQWRFVVADDRLHSVAEKEGGVVIHPLRSHGSG